MEYPVVWSVGSVAVPAHTVFELLGYSLGLQTFLWFRRRHGDAIPSTQRTLLAVAAVLGGLMGSIVLAALEHMGAGLIVGKTIVGGLLGGWLAVEAAKGVMRIKSRTGDLYAVPLCVGIAVGRIGCFLAGTADGTHGAATGFGWGMDWGDGVLRHPTQLYEIVFLLVLASWLMARSPRWNTGQSFRTFMGAYLAWRFIVAFLQPVEKQFGFSAIQWACLLVSAYLAVSQLRRSRASALLGDDRDGAARPETFLSPNAKAPPTAPLGLDSIAAPTSTAFPPKMESP